MDSDDDFIAPSQFSRTQNRSNSTNRSQAVTSSSMKPTGSQVRPNQPGSQDRSQIELSQIRDGLKFLMDRVQQLSGVPGDSRGIKRPAEAKPFDKIPNIKEECQICHKLYANKTTLFRHYRAMHQEMNPEKYHGCSVNNTVVSLDASFREIQCSICSYVAPNQSSFDAHNRTTHNNVVNANSNSAVAANDNVTNKENVNIVNVKDKMHKCDECACYFEERSKFDEHMKVQHGFEVVCKICNKNFLFKDIDGHVKDSHPDVYNKKRKEIIEKVIVEKVMKNKKGSRVHVFICVKCDIKMFDKIEADKHARGHKKGLKIKVAPRNKVSKADEKVRNVTLSDDDNVILTCLDCDISTGSYDAAVEHAQRHMTKKSNDIQFVTQLCEICDLKFEPLCYKNHIDLHYKNKEIHRESFKYFKYMFELLLTENWYKCFNMAEPVVQKMVSKSIYAHTRSVKMRVLHDGSYTLYKCCKCDDFVEPAAVVNHTVNYDTCIKVRCSYPCNICKRTFNNRLARNNHAKDHKNEEAYKIVLFNHENDKEFNEVLNDPKFRLNNEVIRGGSNNSDDLTKVLFKCLCGLCFVRKQTADNHKKICPGKDTKKLCRKCDNFFIQEELLAHRFEHHLNEKPIVIENIFPDVIVIDSDEEVNNEHNFNDKRNIIVIDSSDEEDTHNECFDNIKLEVLRANDATAVEISSANEEHNQKLNVPETSVSAASLRSKEQMPKIGKTEKDNMDEDEDRTDGELNNELTSDDSQDTISYENTNTIDPAPDTNRQGEFKLVPTRLLLNPLHEENSVLKLVDTVMLNAEINTDIENVRQQIERTTDGYLNETAIKKENSWLFDPTDFSNICRRPSLRQIEMHPSSNNLEVESLLTDDEETDINPDNEEASRHVRENATDNVSNNVPAVVEQISNETEDVLNEIPHIANHNDITQNNIDETRDGNVFDKESNDRNDSQAIYDSAQIIDEVENNEDYSDDDLFLPSGIENPKNTYNMELNNNEKLTHKDVTAEKAVNHEHELCNNKGASKITSVERQEIAIVHILTNETECNDNITSDNENYASVNADNNTNPKEIDVNTTEREDEDTVNFGESGQRDIPIDTANDIIEPSIVSNDHVSEGQTRATDLRINIKKEFQYMNINIKRELIAENEYGTESDCDKGCLVQVKTEPNVVLETESENKENDYVVKNMDNDNYNNCSIV